MIPVKKSLRRICYGPGLSTIPGTIMVKSEGIVLLLYYYYGDKLAI